MAQFGGVAVQGPAGMRTLAVEDNGGSRGSDVDMVGSLRFTWSRILFQNTHNCSTISFFEFQKENV